MKYILRILLVLVIVCLFASLIYEVLSKGQSQYRNGYAKYKRKKEDKTGMNVDENKMLKVCLLIKLYIM